MLEFKTKKELEFLLKDENIGLLRDEIIKTKGSIIYYYSFYDLENEFKNKKFDDEINKILSVKFVMTDNIVDKYIDFLSNGVVLNKNNIIYKNSDLIIEVSSDLNKNKLNYFKNLKKLIDSNLFKIDVDVFISYLKDYTYYKKNDRENTELIKVLDDLKTPLINSIAENKFSSLILKQILLKKFENKDPQTESEFQAARAILLLENVINEDILSSLARNIDLGFNGDDLNFLNSSMLRFFIYEDENINVINEAKKSFEHLLENPQIGSEEKFWKYYVSLNLRNKEIDKVKNLLHKEDVADQIVYALWLIENESKNNTKVVDELLKDWEPDRILNSLFKSGLKVVDSKMVFFLNESLKSGSEVWEKVFLNDKFLEKIEYNNDYNDKVAILEQNIFEKVSNFFTESLRKKINSRKVKMTDLVLASNMVLTRDDKKNKFLMSSDLLMQFKKAQDDIFGDEIEYLNFPLSNVIYKNLSSLIEEEVAINKDSPLKELTCFSSNFKLWDESLSKMEFFQKFHDMYLTGTLNGIQNIPVFRLVELKNETLKKPSVYHASSIHKKHRMFVNEARLNEILKAWLINAFNSNNETIINGLFTKFNATVNLQKFNDEKIHFINCVANVLKELSKEKNIDEKIYQNHSFFKSDEFKKEKGKCLNSLLERNSFEPRDFPDFIIKELWDEVLKKGDKKEINVFVKNIIRKTKQAHIIKDYIDVENCLIEALPEIMFDLDDFLLNNDKKNIKQNLQTLNVIKDSDDYFDRIKKSIDLGMLDKCSIDDVHKIMFKEKIDEFSKSFYNLVANQMSKEDEHEFLKRLKYINENCPFLIVNAIPEIDVNDIDRNKQNLKFLSDFPAIKTIYSFMHREKFDFNNLNKSERLNVYSLLESNNVFNDCLNTTYVKKESHSSNTNFELAWEILVGYITEKESINGINFEGLIDYVKKDEDGFNNFLLNKKLSFNDTVKITECLLSSDIINDSTNNLCVNVVYDYLNKYIENNGNKLEDFQILTLIDLNNQYIMNNNINVLRGKDSNFLIKSYPNIFEIELVEQLLEKCIMKKQISDTENSNVKKNKPKKF